MKLINKMEKIMKNNNKQLIISILIMFLSISILGIISRVYKIDLKHILFLIIILGSGYITSILKRTP